MPSRPQSPQEALECVIEGNQRFVQRRSLHSKISEEAFVSLRDGQRPFAVILVGAIYELSTGKVRWLDR